MDRAVSGYRGKMARPIWSGTISFGLVNVPVKAYSAVHDHAVHFHQLEKDTGARIRYEKVSGESGEPVPKEEIEQGFEVSKGHYVVVDAEELDDLRPHTTKTIDISDFVELAAIDPIYYEHTYWLGADESGAKAYRLLQAAMEDAQRVGIGSVVMRNKQYLAAVRPLQGALALSTMRFADEIVAVSDVDGVPGGRAKPAPKELRLASQIVDALTADWEPEQYHDTYTEQLRDLIAAKAKGKQVTVEAEEEEPSAKVIDLMEALQASVEAQRAGRGRAPSRRSAKPKGAKAKKADKAAKRSGGRTKASARATTSSGTRRRSSA
jgi:DNA end-binding protein Ku